MGREKTIEDRVDGLDEKMDVILERLGGGGNGNPADPRPGRFSRQPERARGIDAEGDISVPCKMDLGGGQSVRYYVPLSATALKSEDDFRAALDDLERRGHVVDVYQRRAPDAGGDRGRGGGRFGGGNGGRGGGQMFEVTCDGCGKLAQVPFQPRGDDPVYCRDCFRDRRGGRGGGRR